MSRNATVLPMPAKASQAKAAQVEVGPAEVLAALVRRDGRIRITRAELDALRGAPIDLVARADAAGALIVEEQRADTPPAIVVPQINAEPPPKRGA